MPEPPVDFEEFKRANRDLGPTELPEIPGRGSYREPHVQQPPMGPDEDMGDEEEDFRPLPRLVPRDRGRDEIKQERRRAIEELTEGVVEEKWNDFRRRIDDINSKFQQINDRIAVLEQKLGQVESDKKSDVLEIESKIDTYKQSIDGIDSRMEAVEKAMKDSLTPMMQTLRSLSEAIKALKEK
jgi:DNA repair exonuclease SbcCD ATPase subunit